MEYNDKMSPDQQVTMEENIASLIFTELLVGDANTNDEARADEDLAAELGRNILRMVLEEFRPDLFDREDVLICAGCRKTIDNPQAKAKAIRSKDGAWFHRRCWNTK